MCFQPNAFQVERTHTFALAGVTHIIPVADGYVIGSCIKHIPLAGRDITNFIQLLMRERENTIPPDDAMEVCSFISLHFLFYFPPCPCVGCGAGGEACQGAVLLRVPRHGERVSKVRRRSREVDQKGSFIKMVGIPFV